MQITQITLQNYRNYKKEKISFSPFLNIIVGRNAQGKTNLLEAIYLACLTKSLRTTKDKDLIYFGQNQSRVKINLQKSFGEQLIEINLFKNQKKNIKINDLTVLRVGDLLGSLQAVYFCPDELKLIKDSPENRRRFLDISISQANKSYFYTLLRFEKILAQRNKLLKAAITFEEIKPSLSILTHQLIEESHKIIYERRRFIENLKSPLQKTHSFLTNNQEQIEISYQSIPGETKEEIRENLIKELQKNEDKEFKERCTQAGPHRDDFKIICHCCADSESQPIDLRHFGSQGQQRTATLSLKLSKLIILEEQCGEKPILLLDDVLSELDHTRRQKLLEIAGSYQTVLTATDVPPNLPKNTNIIKIQNGEVINQ